MTTTWVLKSSITTDDINFMNSCGIISDIKEFGKHPIKCAKDSEQWWKVEHDGTILTTHTMRILFHSKNNKEMLLLQLKYGDRLILASSHWTKNITGANVTI
jgi:hypothetical protein